MINRQIFFSRVRSAPFPGHLTDEQVDGLTRILVTWERLELTDLRWLANMLGETFHETGERMQPIREWGSAAYLQSKPYYPYVGEGLIQVTWEANYRKFGAEHPGDLLTWPYALRALFDGMIKGMFTGKKLADYFNDRQTDWLHARQIINGMDRAAEVAAYSKQFYAALSAAGQWGAAGTA